MMEIMKAGGGNNFKQPHFDDDQCPPGTIPLQLKCDKKVIDHANNLLLGA